MEESTFEASFRAVARLYSSANYNDNFVQHADPEVLRTPLEGVALVMKAMGIDKVRYMQITKRNLVIKEGTFCNVVDVILEGCFSWGS